MLRSGMSNFHPIPTANLLPSRYYYATRAASVCGMVIGCKWFIYLVREECPEYSRGII